MLKMFDLTFPFHEIQPLPNPTHARALFFFVTADQRGDPGAEGRAPVWSAADELGRDRQPVPRDLVHDTACRGPVTRLQLVQANQLTRPVLDRCAGLLVVGWLVDGGGGWWWWWLVVVVGGGWWWWLVVVVGGVCVRACRVVPFTVRTATSGALIATMIDPTPLPNHQRPRRPSSFSFRCPSH